MSADWLVADWPAPGNVIAGCTFRHGGVSRGQFESLNVAAHVGDDAAAVAQNRRGFAELCALPGEPRWLNQVHGIEVVATGNVAGDADAIVTQEANEVCVIQTADCLPVLLAAADGSAIAAAHAGWRGLVDGVLEATVSAMQTSPDTLLAWIGPAISQGAFEVGPEVREQFLLADAGAESCFAANSAGRWQADLVGLARQRLSTTGVMRVFGGDRCTFNEPKSFFSYRRDGQCGRMASFVYRQ